jgi:hypothetical protein
MIILLFLAVRRSIDFDRSIELIYVHARACAIVCGVSVLL